MQVLMGHRTPFFSIVIPTYNRPERLATCLESISEVDYGRDRFQVIVVDDGSQISVEPVVARFYDKFDLTLITQTNAGPAQARNTGAARAKGNFLVFTDDDCTLAADYLQKLEVSVIKTPDYLIGGRTLNALEHNLYSTASQALIDYLYDYYNTGSKQSNFFASNNFAMPTEYFNALGGFDTTFPLAAGEDREFCDRWLRHGYKMTYAPDVQIYHAHKLTLTKFWHQHFNYGRGAFCFHKTRSQHELERVKVEPISFYSNLLMYPLTQTSDQPSLLIAALFFLSQVANVAGFFWERLNQNAGKFA